MGQRHQVFIKTRNPNYGKNKSSIGSYVDGKFQKDPRTQKALGSQKYTVLAYHHQWLFGLSAAHIAHKLMKLALSFDTANEYNKKYTHPLSPDFDKLGSSTLERVGDYFKYYMGITDETFPRGTGLEHFTFLNPDQPGMREHFDWGDNNDGITIVDMINKKYCLMNIYDCEEGYESVHILPSKTPVSAAEYARTYYPTEKNKLHESRLEEKSPDEIQALLKEHRDSIAKIEKMFEGMEVFSLEEVKETFPKVFKEETVKSK